MLAAKEHRTGSERRSEHAARFFDRRGGFDRRRLYPVLGTLRDRPWTLVAALVLINALSMLDGFLTSGELSLGVASEANPVFGSILQASPLLAAGFKAGVMLLVSFAIWRFRRYRAVIALAPIALLVYVLLLAYHLGSLRGLGLV